MSFAVHLLVTEEFSEECYRRFLGKVQNLFGEWNLEELVALDENPCHLTIHECWIQARNTSPDEWFRLNVEACRHLKEVFVWPFEHNWHVRFETSTGRGAIGLAVQLGAWILAAQTFRFSVAIDRDSCATVESTEFHTKEAVTEHVRRVLESEFPESSLSLKQRGIVSVDGLLLLQPARASENEKRIRIENR